MKRVGTVMRLLWRESSSVWFMARVRYQFTGLLAVCSVLMDRGGSERTWTVDTIPCEFVGVVLEFLAVSQQNPHLIIQIGSTGIPATYLLTQQPRPPQSPQKTQKHALPRIKPKLPILRPATIQRAKHAPDLILRTHGSLHLPAAELQLVRKVRRKRANHVLERDVLLRWSWVGYADCEEVADEVWVP